MAGDTRVPIETETDVVSARQAGRALAETLGFRSADVTRIATAISEIARNIVEYAVKGALTISAVTESGRSGIQIVAEDEGPGIPDIGLAMQDGYTTRHASLGLGLPGARRLMDEFEISSEVGKGTKVVMRKWKS
ncbi:MAG: anti-sigma regulatory factor [Deltaproteobacteria bacterium]|nr:anti-sigma regulatory factor [Deltaproteobacteria bacterium]